MTQLVSQNEPARLDSLQQRVQAYSTLLARGSRAKLKPTHKTQAYFSALLQLYNCGKAKIFFIK
jgi:hypothetical protein